MLKRSVIHYWRNQILLNFRIILCKCIKLFGLLLHSTGLCHVAVHNISETRFCIIYSALIVKCMGFFDEGKSVIL